MGIAMTEGGDGDAAPEIKITAPISCSEPSAFAPFEGNVEAIVGRHQRRMHASLPPRSCLGRLQNRYGPTVRRPVRQSKNLESPGQGCQRGGAYPLRCEPGPC